MSRWMYLLLVALVTVSHVYGLPTMPTACTHDKGMYECDYSTLSTDGLLPLSVSQFANPVPQRLRLTNLHASITSNIFNSNFASIVTGSFDTSFPATLELKCTSNSLLTVSQSAFQYFGSIVRDFKIINCKLTANANAFTYLGTLDRFVVENGTIDSMAATVFDSVDIGKESNPSPTYAIQTGEMIIKDSAVAGGALPSALITSQSNLVSITLENIGISTMADTFFSGNTKLRYINLGYNSMTVLPPGLFNNLSSLAEVRLYSTSTACSCDGLWIYELAETTQLKVYGDFLCTTPSHYENKKASVYYYANCVTVTEFCSDNILMMGACVTIFEIAMYGVCVLAFILAAVVLGLAIHTKRKMNPGSSGGKKGGPGARKKPLPKKPGAPRGAKQGWA